MTGIVGIKFLIPGQYGGRTKEVACGKLIVILLFGI
jgi:hypothetical protein